MAQVRHSKFTLPLSEEEKGYLTELAAAQEPPLSLAMYLRWLIRSQYRKLKRPR